MCLLRNERYKTFSFRRQGYAPGGRTCRYRGGLGSQKKFPKFNQIWRVSYLHQWHMQRHNFFGAPPPGALGRGQKVKYHKVNFKVFLNQTLCVFSQKKYIKNIRRDFHSIAWVIGVRLRGILGGGGVKKNFPPNLTSFGM